MQNVEVKNTTLCCPWFPLAADTDKTSTCSTEERKAKIEGREEAFITVLAEGVWGRDRSQKRVSYMVHLFFCVT
jgi:hypothetical protein